MSSIRRSLTAQEVNSLVSDATVNALVSAETVNALVGAATVNALVSDATVNALVSAETVNALVGAATVNGHITKETLAGKVFESANMVSIWEGNSNKLNIVPLGLETGMYSVEFTGQQDSGTVTIFYENGSIKNQIGDGWMIRMEYKDATNIDMKVFVKHPVSVGSSTAGYIRSIRAIG